MNPDKNLKFWQEAQEANVLTLNWTVVGPLLSLYWGPICIWLNISVRNELIETLASLQRRRDQHVRDKTSSRRRPCFKRESWKNLQIQWRLKHHKVKAAPLYAPRKPLMVKFSLLCRTHNVLRAMCTAWNSPGQRVWCFLSFLERVESSRGLLTGTVKHRPSVVLISMRVMEDLQYEKNIKSLLPS